MRHTGDYWEVNIKAPAVPDVYWYYFTVNIGGKICYYGAQGSRTGGIGCVYSDHPPSYQITVYDAGFDVPRVVSEERDVPDLSRSFPPERLTRQQKKASSITAQKVGKFIITKSGKKSRFSARCRVKKTTIPAITLEER